MEDLPIVMPASLIFSIAICASVLLLGVSAEVEANIGTKADDSTAKSIVNSQFIARQATSNFVFMENVSASKARKDLLQLMTRQRQ
ncbi:hypothetical protein D8674_023534 [Pyrus ussuriensis x Pyrus communis]|uniref:Uncharacterized protein n=1 Tax=Pyrus ussuriensis x Pyrus communis TaxID=2448454 RepID=A0A5N5H5I6_9ROSA|nr:hypothetical protein D8674_023534 [Pyrus ussuriensis x Pyrus communis]